MWCFRKLGIRCSSARLLTLLSLVNLSACVVDAVCYSDGDCGEKGRCEVGRCIDISCTTDSHCREAQVCNFTLGICEDACPRGESPLDCPQGMVSVEDAFCIDIYEASRVDATASSAGSDPERATSRAGVIPWEATNAEAQAACEAAGKDLCAEREWACACRGPERTVYAYGDTYEPETCNGIDTFCFCDGACAGRDPCPFAGCFRECGAALHLMATGENGGCRSSYGAYDLNGNVWEHVKGGNPMRVRGGAFNCADSQTLHRCDYIPGDWAPSARGFRCCWRPQEAR